MTVGTNALLEERGARTALVATEGFTDLLEIARQNRPAASTASARRSRRRWSADELRLEAAERVGPERRRSSRSPDGELERLVAASRASRAPSRSRSACCSPTSTPRHERAIAERLRDRAARRPRLGLARGAAAVSRVRALLDDRDRRLPLPPARPLPGPARRGGRRARAARAGGDAVLGRRRAGRRGGARRRLERALGPRRRRGRRRPARARSRATATRSGSTWAAPPATSAWSRTARVRRTDSREIGGRVIQLPMVDVHTVGAGGGSIGWRDSGGALRVGPAVGGRRARARLLRARRHRADGHRRQPAARLPRRRLDARRRRRARRARPPRRAVGAARRRARARAARDRRGDRPGRQPGDGAGAAGGHRRARRRPARLRADAVRRRRADARRRARRGARDRADPLPARQRRALGARPDRLRAPPRHRPHRDAERRRADRRADRRRGRRAARVARRAGSRTPRPRSPTSCATAARPSSSPVEAARRRPTPPSSRERFAAEHERRYGYRDPDAEVELVNDPRWRWSSRGPRREPSGRRGRRARARQPPGALRRRVGRGRGAARRAAGRRRRPRARASSSCPRRRWCCRRAGAAKVDERGDDRRGARAMSARLDPVTLQVLVGALRAACEEMGAVLVRSAHSANIKERRDCSTALFDAARRAGDAGRAHPGPPRLDARRGRRRARRASSDPGDALDPQRPLRGRHPPARHHPDLARSSPTATSCSASPPAAPTTPTSAARRRAGCPPTRRSSRTRAS